MWAFVVLGLLVRSFGDALVGPSQPRAVEVVPVRLCVNRATVAELSVLPGIGRTRAEAIVVERIRHGPFREPADLERVDGLGPATIGFLRGMVTFELPMPPTAR